MRYRAFIKPWPLTYRWQTGIIDTTVGGYDARCAKQLHSTLFFAKRRFKKMKRQAAWLNEIDGAA